MAGLARLPKPAPALRRTRRPFTPQEFLDLDDAAGWEMLDDGTLEERPMSVKSGWVTNRVVFTLMAAPGTQTRGVVISDTGLQIFPDRPSRIPRADCGFISFHRLDGGEDDGFLRRVPELLVEVVSPGDRFERLEGKVAEYLAAGVSTVWVVRPLTRSVDVCRSDGTVIHLAGSDVIGGDSFLPDFRTPVSAFFPE
ncbi:MAG: Uma2 family endonuclease [Dehalococcoidia bacterium]